MRFAESSRWAAMQSCFSTDDDQITKPSHHFASVQSEEPFSAQTGPPQSWAACFILASGMLPSGLKEQQKIADPIAASRVLQRKQEQRFCMQFQKKDEIRMTALPDNKGFSLIEVMVVVAIIGVMSAIAVPPFFSWLSNKGIQSAARSLYTNLKKAQSLAVKLNRNCAITFNGATGYTVYVDASTPWNPSAVTNANFVYDSSAGERVVAQLSWTDYRNVQLASAPTFAANTAGDSSLAFQPNLIPLEPDGSLSTDRAVVLTNSNGKKATVSVSVSGNISLKFE